MNDLHKKSVVIISASSGIGRAAVALMASPVGGIRGCKVQHGDQLRSDIGASIAPVILDVTDRASVKAAPETVSPILTAILLH